MHAEDLGLESKLLMQDRDTKFTKEFDEIINLQAAKSRRYR